MKELKLQDHVIAQKGEMISLTDLWRASGGDPNRRPKDWLERESTKEFVDYISDGVKLPYRSTKGGKDGGSTIAHWQIALAYAKWLSPAFHAEVNEAYRQAQAETRNPQLSVDKAVARWKKMGKTDAEITANLDSTAVRNSLTTCFGEHGITKPQEYAGLTNATYTPLFGGGAKHIREKKGLDKAVNIRDHMSIVERAAVTLAEELAKERIEQDRLYGYTELEGACVHTSRAVASGLVNARKK